MKMPTRREVERLKARYTNAYLEMERGLYRLRMIARKGDYNLYLHVLSKAALKGGGPG